jgi:hypothetical protein
MRRRGIPVGWVYVIAIWLGVVVMAIVALSALVGH